MEYETLLEIITARDVRRAHAFRQQTVEEGADFDELFTGIDNTARKRDFGGTLVSITSTSFLILFLISFPFRLWPFFYYSLVRVRTRRVSQT